MSSDDAEAYHFRFPTVPTTSISDDRLNDSLCSVWHPFPTTDVSDDRPAQLAFPDFRPPSKLSLNRHLTATFSSWHARFRLPTIPTIDLATEFEQTTREQLRQ